jgi:hypothetical protein
MTGEGGSGVSTIYDRRTRKDEDEDWDVIIALEADHREIEA